MRLLVARFDSGGGPCWGFASWRRRAGLPEVLPSAAFRSATRPPPVRRPGPSVARHQSDPVAAWGIGGAGIPGAGAACGAVDFGADFGAARRSSQAMSLVARETRMDQ